MKNTKKTAASTVDTVNAINKLNKKPKPSMEKIREKIGTSMIKIKMHVKIDVDRYSTKGFFIPLIFKSFFKPMNKSK